MTTNTLEEELASPDKLIKQVDEKISAYESEKATSLAEIKKIQQRFNQIEEKSKCLRVRFLDWLSNKLLDWSNRIHEISARIDSPCVIKVEPRTREDSKNFKENKEIACLKQWLRESSEREYKLKQELKNKDS